MAAPGGARPAACASLCLRDRASCFVIPLRAMAPPDAPRHPATRVGPRRTVLSCGETTLGVLLWRLTDRPRRFCGRLDIHPRYHSGQFFKDSRRGTGAETGSDTEILQEHVSVLQANYRRLEHKNSDRTSRGTYLLNTLHSMRVGPLASYVASYARCDTAHCTAGVRRPDAVWGAAARPAGPTEDRRRVACGTWHGGTWEWAQLGVGRALRASTACARRPSCVCELWLYYIIYHI
jgi:hypothetical protein